MTDEELKRLLEATAERIEQRFDKRFEAMDKRFDSIDKRLDAHDDRFTAIDKRFDSIDKRLDAHDDRFTTIDKRFDATDEKIIELRRHVGVIEERWDTKFEILAEGLRSLNEKVDRKASTVAEEHTQAIADTQAMIKFSHAELDRRIRFMEQTLRQLEDGYANLSTRVERLEEIKSNEN